MRNRNGCCPAWACVTFIKLDPGHAAWAAFIQKLTYSFVRYESLVSASSVASCSFPYHYFPTIKPGDSFQFSIRAYRNWILRTFEQRGVTAMVAISRIQQPRTKHGIGIALECGYFSSPYTARPEIRPVNLPSDISSSVAVQPSAPTCSQMSCTRKSMDEDTSTTFLPAALNCIFQLRPLSSAWNNVGSAKFV